MDTEQANNSYNKAIYKEMVDNPLPPMTLRIGVAGHRDLSKVDMQRLREEINTTYTDIYAAVQQIATDEIAKSIYANDENTNTKSVIRIISSLAEGADRLCIPDKALFEYELACILPFSAIKFIRDFSPGKSVTNPELDSVTEFYTILERIGFYRRGRHGYYNRNAPVIELDGNPTNRDEAYNNCSRLLVEHSDILIAVYNGKDNNGNGTDAAVKAAMQKGIPVIHISTELNQERRINPWEKQRAQKNFCAVLEQELKRMLLFTNKLKDIQPEVKQAIQHRFEQYRADSSFFCSIQKEVPEKETPDYDNTGPIVLTTEYRNLAAKVFDFLKNCIATKPRIQDELVKLAAEKTCQIQTTPPERPKRSINKITSINLDRYYAAFLYADRLANYFSRTHRSTFVLIYLLGAAALIAATCALTLKPFHQGKPILDHMIIGLVLLELILLAVIYWLYNQDRHRKKYHKRWLEYRHLSEMLRPMLYLSLLSRTYTGMASHHANQHSIITMATVERDWQILYIETLHRWIGFNRCLLGKNNQENKDIHNFITETWCKGQANYHCKNAAVMRILGKRLEKWDFGLFLATVVFVIFKLLLAGTGLFLQLDHSQFKIT